MDGGPLLDRDDLPIASVTIDGPNPKGTLTLGSLRTSQMQFGE